VNSTCCSGDQLRQSCSSTPQAAKQERPLQTLTLDNGSKMAGLGSWSRQQDCARTFAGLIRLGSAAPTRGVMACCDSTSQEASNSPLKEYISGFRLQELQILSDAESVNCSSSLRSFLLVMRIAGFFNELLICQTPAGVFNLTLTGALAS